MNNFTYKCYGKEAEFSTLNGLIIKSITGLKEGEDEVFFNTECGRQFKMYHEQNCCETVYIDDVCGDTKDIVGSVIVQAEERESKIDDNTCESGTWTFYDIWTAKGSVNIKWLGESNGYYSESVSFCEGKSVDKH